MANPKPSADVTGHPGEDGKLLKPLAGKSNEYIFRAHNGLNPQTGEPLPGVQPHEGKHCECSHCFDYQNADSKKKA